MTVKICNKNISKFVTCQVVINEFKWLCNWVSKMNCKFSVSDSGVCHACCVAQW